MDRFSKFIRATPRKSSAAPRQSARTAWHVGISWSQKQKPWENQRIFNTMCPQGDLFRTVSFLSVYVYNYVYIYIFIFLHMNYLKKTKCTYINESSVAQDFLKLWRWELPKGDIEGVPWRAANRERGSNWDDYPSKMKHCNLKKTASAIDIFVCLKLGDTLFTWPFNGANGD